MRPAATARRPVDLQTPCRDLFDVDAAVFRRLAVGAECGGRVHAGDVEGAAALRTSTHVDSELAKARRLFNY
jgi:hypothetical protein